jgi:hypothetical protein
VSATKYEEGIIILTEYKLIFQIINSSWAYRQLLELTGTRFRPVVNLDPTKYWMRASSGKQQQLRVFVYLLASFLLFLLCQEIRRVSRFAVFENDLGHISH